MSKSSSVQNTNEEPTDQVPKSLENFSEEDLLKLYSIGETQTFAVGDIALQEGDTDTSIYIVLEGLAEVTIPAKKEWFKVATLTPGSVFGELSFFDRMPRSARVSVLSDCTVLKISESSFHKLLTSDPGISMAFLLELGKILSIRLRLMNQLVKALVK